MNVAFIGCAGVPNRYGGFEAFVEFCGPHIAVQVQSVQVTCDAVFYPDRIPDYRGMRRKFIGVRANGPASVLHDLIAFVRVLPTASHIVVLGVSGAFWFPLFRVLCDLSGKRLLVNIDGVEWRRDKYNTLKRHFLKCFDWLAQRFAHTVIYDNSALKPYLLPIAIAKSIEIPYSGDHVLRRPDIPCVPWTALTVCRIEPENNIELLIKGALASRLVKYTIIGNWKNSAYGRDIFEKYRSHPKLQLLAPVYESDRLSEFREKCDFYLHGHSVGGTNPSLVEMLFYDCRILCFDVPYNRATAFDNAIYFSDSASLAAAIARSPAAKSSASLREKVRVRFTGKGIADRYLQALVRS